MGTIQDLLDEERYYSKYFSGLSTRAINILHNNNLRTKSEVMEAIKSGRLTSKPRPWNDPRPAEYYCVQRNYGKKTELELYKWLGLTLPTKKTLVCPHCGKEVPYKKWFRK